jgi:hypothetical protein
MIWLSIVSTLLSPVIAVIITLWWQNRKEKRDAKERLFLTLMAHRKAYPPSQQWVDGLNVIDVVFADIPQVVELWHRYYEYLAVHSPSDNYQSREHTYLLMLSAMARSLGYRKLEQTDIDKFYSPQAHGNQLELNYRCQTEWLRVLENTAKLEVTLKTKDVLIENK